MPEAVRSGPIYATPQRLWSLAFPDQINASDFTPGLISPLTFIGTGSGTLVLSRLPYDEYAYTVKVSFTGEPGTARIRCSEDSVLFSPEILIPTPDEPIDLVTHKGFLIGLQGTFTEGITPPSFVLDDSWTFSTLASPSILDALGVASDYIDGEIGNLNDNGGRYHLPLQSWPSTLADVCAKIARFNLLAVRGFDFKEKDVIYLKERDWAFRWLADVKNYRTNPGIVETTPVSFAPSIISGPDPIGIVKRRNFGYDSLGRKRWDN